MGLVGELLYLLHNRLHSSVAAEIKSALSASCDPIAARSLANETKANLRLAHSLMDLAMPSFQCDPVNLSSSTLATTSQLLIDKTGTGSHFFVEAHGGNIRAEYVNVLY